MKTISTTDAKNQFGAFLDAGMTEGVRLVRNNRVIGYFVPTALYAELTSSKEAKARDRVTSPAELTPRQLDTLRLYSAGEITSTEAKTTLNADRWGLLDLLARYGLRLPHVPIERAKSDVLRVFGYLGTLPSGSAPTLAQSALRTCDMILMDASPLIYLAKAGLLDLLLNFGRTIYVADEVYHEVCGRWFSSPAGSATGISSSTDAPPDAGAIHRFIQDNAERFQIVPTQLGQMLSNVRATRQDPGMRDAGEMASVSVYDRRLELTGARDPVLLIFEDTEVPLRLAAKDAHILSTYGLFVAMASAGLLLSADEAYESIPIGGRPAKPGIDASLKGDTEYESLLSRKTGFPR